MKRRATFRRVWAWTPLALIGPIVSACDGGHGSDATMGLRTSGSPHEQPFRLAGEGALLGQQVAPGFPAGTSDFGGRCSSPAHFVIAFAVSGEATHLGRSEGRLEHCTIVDFATGNASFIDGVLSLVASNGDELYGAYEGGSSAEGFRDRVTFDGGTGRFAAAAGQGIQQGFCDRTTGRCPVYRLAGDIVFDASDRDAGGR